MMPPPAEPRHSLPKIDPSASTLEAIATLCDWVEARAEGANCGVCIANTDSSVLLRAIFPNVPASFQSAIKNIPMAPPYFGACNAVIHEAKVFTCHDMTKETRFHEDFVQLCVGHGIHSLQSWPVFGRSNAPIGTFVMAHTKFRPDPAFDPALIADAVGIAGEILQRERDQSAAITAT